jgi:metallo-beta-lactamase family protein
MPFDPAAINHVFLTHAHLDHVGMIPELYRRGFRGRVWCTRETQEIATVNLLDAARQRTADGRKTMPYGERDVHAINWRQPDIQPVFNKRFPVDDDLWACFFRSAHIVGAVSVSIAWGPKHGGQRTILFSGDLGVNADGAEQQALMKYRMDDRKVDYAICESTYGHQNRQHLRWEDRVAALADAVDPICANRGLGIMPVFSIGRLQDMQWDIAAMLAMYPERFADLDVRVHAPMGMRISNIAATAFNRTEIQRSGSVKSMWLNPNLGPWIGLDRSPAGESSLAGLVASVLRAEGPPQDLAERFPGSVASRIDGSRLRVVDHYTKPSPGRPTLILASSGMCNGGPVLEYLKWHLGEDATTLLQVGYASPRTLANQLSRLATVPLDQRSRLSETLDLRHQDGRVFQASEVRATVRLLSGYSGHADQDGLIQWLIPPKQGTPVAPTIVLTHGQEHARQALAERLKREAPSVAVILPQSNQGSYDLDLGRWCDAHDARDGGDPLARIRELEAQIAMMRRINVA